MPQTIKKAPSAQAKKTPAPKSPGIGIFNLAELKETVEEEFSSETSPRKNGDTAPRPPQKAPTRQPLIDTLDPINPMIPYSRSFITQRQASKGQSEERGKSLMTNLRQNMKGIMGNMRVKEMNFQEILELRNSIGNLKKTSVDTYAPSPDKAASKEIPKFEQKTKKQLLKEKKETIHKQAVDTKKDKAGIGMRIEIERLKKKFPDDQNLAIISAILTSQDGCLKHRTIEERVTSLHAALFEAGLAVNSGYITTFSIDTLFDIYFLYLSALKKMQVEKFRKISTADVKIDPVIVESIRRDIRILNFLLEQSRLKKTISNLARKLNGHAYPFVPLTPLDVSKTFEVSQSNDNEKVGPGTIKLNKFLIRIYLSVFAQIPFFQPIAKKLCEGMSTDLMGKTIVANVTLDNALTQMKISKAGKEGNVPKQITSIFNYGKRFIEANIKENPTTALEGRILLKTAEMAEEYGFSAKEVEPEIIQYGHHCASLALPFYSQEAEAIIRRLFEIAEIKGVPLT